ncbi:hypothetical protein J2R78_007381 [Bradyrhizobium sp. USDA 4538]|uniref:hypothetical protein n=1 Tax=unclassified Bradyrhizobium TaxID=2631580 RepID=UPI00209F0241|nr:MULTISPECIES: hypothetical protein [unclassified Bradyrhizobium]MCP1844414.1 hypothetical protein [Bradyrhizobium sp. USDA 4538]MCP1904980.1 hypothetical protein [Bradyrhizobium sp. USDA 4537]MCP1989364.1 hypothetical protein [Bradyrhizobium sp. USDA 4539]
MTIDELGRLRTVFHNARIAALEGESGSLRDDLEGPAPYGTPELCWNQARPVVAGIRMAILAALRKGSRLV